MTFKKWVEFTLMVIILIIFCTALDYLLSGALCLIVFLFEPKSFEVVFKWIFVFLFLTEMAVFIPAIYLYEKRKED